MKTKFERDRAERRADKKDREQRRHVLYNRIGMVVAALIIGGVIYAIVGGARVQRSVPRPAAPATDATGATAAAPAAARAPCPTRTGEAWEYDRATDCHFDPSAQHAHWHAGRPPDGTERVRRMLDGGGSAEPVSIDPVAAPAPTPPPATAPPFADPD